MVMVSIIVPVYNAEKRISETIKSIIMQSFKDFELFLINDGSKDNSGLICDKFASKDDRIKVFHQNNSGPAAARNKGIEEANGEYIAFVDADDTVDNNWLEEMINAQKKNNVDLVCTGYNKLFYKDSKLLKTIIYNPISKIYKDKISIGISLQSIISNGFFNPLWNKLYKAEIIKNNNIAIDKDFNLGEDFLFNLSYIDKCNSLILLDVSLYNYIVNDSGLTHTYRDDKFELLDSVNNKYREFLVKNDINLGIADFGTIKNCYSCFMDLFDEDNNMQFQDKKKYIDRILNKKKTKEVLKRYKPKGFKKKFLVLVLRTNSTYLIFIVSWLFFIIKFKIKKE